ncbi:MAG: M28 family peptidase [Planctomycetota bacterium]|nr:M28 family peptidase [Planctomycetota bacterium]
MASAGQSQDGGGLSDSMHRVKDLFNKEQAMELVEELDGYYRTRGNDGYLRSVQKVFIQLKAAGFDDAGVGGATLDTVAIRDYGPVLPAWTPVQASFEVVSPQVGVLHQFDDESGLERTFVAVNSFPTPSQGVVAPLMRYDRSQPPDAYAGTIVVGNDPAEHLFKRAVLEGGALGVVSSYLGDYNDPDNNRDAIRYSKVPYDAERQGFALNVSPNKHDVLKRLLDTGPVYGKVTIDARFTDTRSRTLIARIQGSDPEAGTVAVVSHLDEPGTNDNATGVAVLAGIAGGMLRAIRDGEMPRPRRSITFRWGTEFECSREWIASNPGNIDIALIIDMVGQDLAKTGALPLMERIPDPGAVWARPPLDIHSEWGRGDVRESDLQGSFLNDYVLAAMELRKEQTGWPAQSNPFEGGSDHESFLERGIHAVLLWHFTDVYYHTNLDRLDKVDPDEMENMAVAAMTVLHHFSHAGLDRAQECLDVVLAAGRHRLTTEAENARTYLSFEAVANNPTQRQAVLSRERRIVLAWARWYREALLSVVEFEPDPTNLDRFALEGRVDQALSEIRNLEGEILESLETLQEEDQ